MKTTDLVVVGLAGVALYMIYASQSKTAQVIRPTTGAAAGVGTGSTGLTSSASSWVAEIFDSVGARFGNGWRYFENGVSIDPMGNYYKDGQLVYQGQVLTA